MSHRTHQIHLKILRENEQVLHNCSSHPIIHLLAHLYYFIGVLLPMIALIFLTRSNVDRDTVLLAWFLYTCWGLVLTTYFFVKGVNWELGGCVITNQRVLRFGYHGLWQAVEREIAPNKIEDFKIEKQGLFSLLFGTACIYITTSNRQTDVLYHIVDPDKVRDAYATMVKLASGRAPQEKKAAESEAAWIDEALGTPNLEKHRQDTKHAIADVFRGKQKE